MSKYIKIEGEQDLVKDKDTGAILNTNMDSLSAYKQKRHKDIEQKNRIDRMENDIGDIKSMLKELLDKG